MGQTVIMGRKTFEGIGKTLTGRENFVLTHSPRNDGEHLRFFSSLDDALKSVRTQKAFVIGGAELYRQTMDRIDGIYLSRIHQEYEGDTYYPEIPNHFVEKERKTLQQDPIVEVIVLENSKRIQPFGGHKAPPE